MKNVKTGMMLKALFLLAMLTSGVMAEKVLVVVDGPYYDTWRSSGYAVEQYVTDLTAAGNTVYRVNYYETGIYPVEKAYNLYTVIKSYYDANAINGVVLIGELPYAPVYHYIDPTTSIIFPNDYYYMDMKDTNNVYGHTDTWWASRVDAFTFVPSKCDNHAEIWVSRVTGININTPDAFSSNGAPTTWNTLLDEYLGRLHQRMTVAEPQPKRFLCVGMEYDAQTNQGDVGFDKFGPKSIPGWNLWNKHQFYRFSPMTDLPVNWQAQLQRGPYGRADGLLGDTLRNGWKVRPLDSRTYSGIASDTFSFEWAGLFEHSGPTVNWFEGNNDTISGGWFASTDELVAYFNGDPNGHYCDRSLTGMYWDGGRPNAKFIISGGCSNNDISYADCEGELYSLLGNGLICLGSTTEHSWSGWDYQNFMNYLLNTSGATFGTAFINMVNAKAFPTWWDCYMLLGAGTLTPNAPLGYVKKNIFASYTVNLTTNDDATNNCTGTISFTSSSVTGGTYNPASTVYNWYDSSRTKRLSAQGSSVTYSQTYGDSGITIGGYKFYGPIMIEAAQSGFLSGYVQTSAKQLNDSIPTITYVGTSILDVHNTGITNWWIDSVKGHVQYYAWANKPAFDQTTASYKWYDKNHTLKTTTNFCTTFVYLGSRDTLGINKSPYVRFNGNYFVKAVKSGYRWAMAAESTMTNWESTLRYSFDVSGILKRKMGGHPTITSFVPTINTSNGKLDIAGTTTDSGGLYGCIGGTVWTGSRNCQITARDTIFTGSSSRKAGVWFGSYPDYYDHSGGQFLYLYQRPDASVRIRTGNWGTMWDTTIATSGYTVGKTWMRIKRSTDTLYCYTSKNGTSYTQVYKWPNYYDYGAAGVMYSSAGTAGSVRFININVTKY